MNCKLHIAYATDQGYLMPTMVAVASAIAWASRPCDLVFHILDCGITDAQWDEFVGRLESHLKGGYQLLRHVVDMSVFDKCPAYKGRRGNYARLLLPEIVKDSNWCVYCDGDTLFTADPFALETVFDPSKAYQGHEDWLDLKNLPQKKIFESIGLGWHPEQYVCSGFILMNLDWFRQNDATPKAIEFLSRYSHLQPADQEALHYVAFGHVGFLPSAWGMYSWQIFLPESPLPKLIHYVSDLPWKFERVKYLGYVDDRCLWLGYAWRLLRLDLNWLGCPSKHVFFKLRAYTNIWRMVFSALSVVPALRRRYYFVISRFSRREIAKRIDVRAALDNIASVSAKSKSRAM